MKILAKLNNTITAAAIASLLILTGLVGMQIIGAQTASAQDIKQNLCDGAELSLDQKGSCATQNEGSKKKLNDLIADVINIFTVIVGIIAVVMIIIGGFKFITSGGDSNRVASARSTILYAIVGLVIVALAQVIVKFVLSATPS